MVLFSSRGLFPFSPQPFFALDYAIESRFESQARYEFRISFSQGLKYRRFKAFPLIEWNGTSCARKENVNQALGLGKDG